MKIFTKAIVSNSDMIKNYKTCRDKAGVFGKIFIMKNNQPDAVLFSHDEYDRISEIIEYLEDFDNVEVENIVKTLPQVGFKKKHSHSDSIENLKIIRESHFTDGSADSVKGNVIVNAALESPIKYNRIELKKTGNDAP